MNTVSIIGARLVVRPRGPDRLWVFGRYVGTFRRHGERTYWNVSGRATVIVIELADEHFARLIPSVQDAAALVDRINNSSRV